VTTVRKQFTSETVWTGAWTTGVRLSRPLFRPLSRPLFGPLFKPGQRACGRGAGGARPPVVQGSDRVVGDIAVHERGHGVEPTRKLEMAATGEGGDGGMRWGLGTGEKGAPQRL
jgi:hypothetical protein